ncbi:Uma2 family endonuclease [Actinomadura sp. PM05-2]|uniref:Uma2 family endonuclease n=1 Tax=Actinomadura parmotrematis TaxID=2864039 RepID=A0ABS7FS14_9ACTN|nr:Uma2 family endonuclease [Actinomadura parmotrematis]
MDARFELIDGAIMMMAPTTVWHDEVMDLLKHALRRSAPEDRVITTEKGVELNAGTAPEPDVLAVARSAVSAGSYTFVPSDVHLVVEVVSPGTRTKDRKLRPLQYAEAGIALFWRVENENDRMAVYTFELDPATGQYAPTGVHRKVLKVDRPWPMEFDLPDVTW